MTKITILADIHANLPALQAVLSHARAHQADDRILNLGDSIGYGAFPDEVVQQIQKNRMVNIIGNYDKKVLSKKRRKKGWSKIKTPEKRMAFGWAYENLSKKSRKFLKALPKKRTIEIGGFKLMMTHGSPESHTEHLRPDTSEERLRELAAMAKVDIILCGHSHQAFVRKVDDVWFVNPGSVGRPDDGDPRASYAVITLEDGKITVEHFRVPYNLLKAAREAREKGLPEIFAQIVLQGYSYNDLKRLHKPIPETPGLEPSGVLTLLTDFGLKDHFIGVMKGAIAQIAPHARIIDISHQIRPQHIRQSAYMLLEAAPYFPPGTVHVAVVDPGVGTSRRALAAQIGDQFFVAPDNGLLTLLIKKAESEKQPVRLVALDRPQFWLDEVSRSFHGRDIFAPVGAHLVNGLPLEKLGPPITIPVQISFPHPERTSTGWQAEVVMVDTFGNLSTNLPGEALSNGHHEVVVKINKSKINGLTRTFGDAAVGELIATVDSTGALAISVVQGSAAQTLKADIGTPVEIVVD